MRKRQDFLPVFFIFLLFSVVLFVISRSSLMDAFRHGLEFGTKPIEKIIYSISLPLPFLSGDSYTHKIEKENSDLTKKLVKLSILEQDNQALRDQFQTTAISTTVLIPAHVIAAPRFIPGITVPESYIIDQGEKDGIHVGQGVVFEDMAVGRISKTSENIAVVILISNPEFSLTAQTVTLQNPAHNGALGVLKGKGNGQMLLDNVVLSDQLTSSDMVVTYGDVDASSYGFPPHIIIGKIISVNKKSSSLFQSATVKSSLDFSKLSTIFIIQ